MPWWNNKPWKICFFNPFWPSVTFHIETSNLICIAYQMAGFYLRFKTGVKWSKQGVGSLRSTCDVVCCFLKFLRLQVYFLRDILQIMNWKVFGGISFWKTSRWLPLRFERLQDFFFWISKSILTFHMDKKNVVYYVLRGSKMYEEISCSFLHKLPSWAVALATPIWEKDLKWIRMFS